MRDRATSTSPRTSTSTCRNLATVFESLFCTKRMYCQMYTWVMQVAQPPLLSTHARGSTCTVKASCSEPSAAILNKQLDPDALQLSAPGMLWRVADVAVSNAGCEISPLRDPLTQRGYWITSQRFQLRGTMIAAMARSAAGIRYAKVARARHTSCANLRCSHSHTPAAKSHATCPPVNQPCLRQRERQRQRHQRVRRHVGQSTS